MCGCKTAKVDKPSDEKTKGCGPREAAGPGCCCGDECRCEGCDCRCAEGECRC
jgi:hypothetical protein